MAIPEGRMARGCNRGKPSKPAASDGGTTVAPRSPMQPAAPRRVLVVDDESTILFAMREFLSELGFLVHTASEREEAEALLGNVAYVGVIADLRLLGSDSCEGLEVIAAARERSRDTRIIALSAFTCPELEIEARRHGADAVLRKPRPLSEVASCLVDLLEGRR